MITLTHILTHTHTHSLPHRVPHSATLLREIERERETDRGREEEGKCVWSHLYEFVYVLIRMKCKKPFSAGGFRAVCKYVFVNVCVNVCV